MDEAGLEEDVSGHVHCVVKVPLDFVQNVLAGAAQQNGARLGILALLNEGEILIADFANLEETGLGSDVRLCDLVGSVDDGGTAGPGTCRS